MKYKAIVVGCGAIGVAMEGQRSRPKPATHAGALSAHKKTRLVAFVDTDKRKLAAAQRKYPGTRVYTDIAQCLAAEKPDIVALATPPTSRTEAIQACLKAKVSMIVCEKPLARSYADAKKIERMVAKSRTVFVVNYQRRFYSLIEAAKKDIQAGKIGTVQQVSCFYSNGLYSNGGHLIDALHYILGDHIVAAKAFVNVHNKTHPAGDVNIDCLLRTKKGNTITMQSFDQKRYGASEIRIFGQHGALFIREYGFTLVRISARASVFPGVRQLDYDRGKTITRRESAVAGALGEVIACYESRKKNRSSASTASEAVRVLDLIATSAGFRKVK